MNFVTGTGIFEDRATGSTIFLEFTNEAVSGVSFSLNGEGGIVHQWVRMFQQDLAATVEDSRGETA